MSGRPLSSEEAALWQRLVATVEPLAPKRPASAKTLARHLSHDEGQCVSQPRNRGLITARAQHIGDSAAPRHSASTISASMPATKEAFAQMLDQRRAARLHAERPKDRGFFTLESQPKIERSGNLDGHWERRLNKGQVAPDMTVDLHGHNLSAAYSRMDGALAQAHAAQMRVILLITGKARPAAPGTDGRPRGAIRRAMQDWLSASRHAGNIAAVRNAHPRHGGDGALYIILKRRR